MTLSLGGYRMVAVVAGIAAIFGLVGIVTFKLQGSVFNRELAEIESETDRRLGVAPLHGEAISVAAPFATWADMVESLHRAGAASALDRFAYKTAATHALDDPSQSIPDEGETAGETPEVELPPDASPDEVAEVSTPAYRAMTARVEGSGSFASITRFVELLALSEPPLTLDDLEIAAGRPPSFVASVHLDSALPVSAASGATGTGSASSEEDPS